jgi:ribosomal protein S18 acetylase RimI-like enzyme
MIEYMRFTRSHLAGVIRLCGAEGWSSFPADAARAERVLTAPGVTTIVAVDQQEVAGFAELLSDGEIQAYLAVLLVEKSRRGQGIGRALLTETLRLAGGERIDLLSEDSALDFYRTFPHRAKTGFRLYPFYDTDSEH